MKFIRVFVIEGSESFDGQELLVNPAAIAFLAPGSKYRQFVISMIDEDDGLNGCIVSLEQMQLDYLTGEGL